jgi:SAM-dependent methyltransferase
MEINPSDLVGETQQTYDLITAEYASQNAAAWPDLADHINVLAASLPPGGVVADVGCGPGRDIALLRAGGFRVIGIDLSFGQLRTSSLTGVTQADMRQLPLRGGSIDAIWCHAALLHLPRTVVPAVLAEFARATRPGGELFLAVADGDGEGFEVASNYGSDRRRWFTMAPRARSHGAAREGRICCPSDVPQPGAAESLAIHRRSASRRTSDVQLACH